MEKECSQANTVTNNNKYCTCTKSPHRFYLSMSFQGERMLEHLKMLPECRNVTKQNCVTLWQTDPDGKQV